MSRLVRAVALLLLAPTFVAITSTSATAYSAPIFSALDTSQAGHVKGSISTDAPYVRFLDDATDFFPELGPAISVGGSANFDRETWGREPSTPYSLRVALCSGSAIDTCETVRHVSQTFFPRDVTPSLSWPADTDIGPDEHLVVGVSDPAGGGILVTRWIDGGGSLLNRNGQTTVELTEGTGTLSILRCSIAVNPRCSEVAPGRLINVNRIIELRSTGFEPSPTFDDSDSATADTSAIYELDDGQDGSGFSVTWRLIDESGDPVPGVSGTVSDLNSQQESISFPIDLTGVPSGSYRVAGQMSYDAPRIGRLTADLPEHSYLVVDNARAALRITNRPRTTIYPERDRYRDQVQLGVTSDQFIKLEGRVVDAAGAQVQTLSSDGFNTTHELDWAGRDEADVIFPAGIYTLHATARTQAGIVTRLPVYTVRLHRERLYERKFTKEITVKASDIDRFRGKCSSFAKPKGRGWKGGLGLYSNTRCTSKKWAKTGIAVVNAVQLPTAHEYGRVEIDAFAGAAKAKRSSHAYLEIWNYGAQKWANPGRLEPKVRWQTGSSSRAIDALYGERFVAWRTVTGFGARYDVKKFRVTLDYTSLELPRAPRAARTTSPRVAPPTIPPLLRSGEYPRFL